MLAILYLYQIETVHTYQVLDVCYTIPIPGVGCLLHYTHTRCWMVATLYPYQVLDFLHPPVNSKLQNDINIRCSVLATLYIFWNLYIHTRCWMLATLYLYQVETVHPYQLLDVGYTTPIPGVGCWRYYTCSYIRCWRQYIYNRCWMLATLYAYTRCFIPMVYH